MSEFNNLRTSVTGTVQRAQKHADQRGKPLSDASSGPGTTPQRRLRQLRAAIATQRAAGQSLRQQIDDERRSQRLAEKSLRQQRLQHAQLQEDLDVALASIEFTRRRRHELQRLTERQEAELHEALAGRRKLTRTVLETQQAVGRLAARFRDEQ